MSIIFNLITFFTILFAIFAISTNNTIYAVFSLIAIIMNIAILFIAIQAEFLGMILIILYIGAVAILFLFTVMMIKLKAPTQKLIISPPLYLIFGLLIIAFIFKIFETSNIAQLTFPEKQNITIKTIGNLLYTEYILIFQIIGIILLTSIIGTIMLLMDSTNTKNPQQKTQKPNTAKLISIKYNQGIDYESY